MIDEEIVNLYTVEFQSIKNISNLYNISKYKVKSILQNNGISENLKYYKQLNKLKLYETAIDYYKESKSLNKTCKKYNLGNKNNFSNYLKSKGIEVINYNNQISQKENIFEQIDSEEKSYWLGFYMLMVG